MGVHEGHRARLKQRFEVEGLDGFQPHEALELLLFHAVARRDVNPLAHALIDRFGSLHGTLAAGEGALSEVTGVGARTAALVSFLPEFFVFYRAQRPEDRPTLRNLSAAQAYCQRLIPDRRGDRLWLMHLSAGGGLILAESLPAPGGYPKPRQVLERLLASHAQALVLAACREDAALVPMDRTFAGIMNEMLSMIGVTLLDGLILDGAKTSSFRHEGFLNGPLRETAAPSLMERSWLRGDGGEGPTP